MRILFMHQNFPGQYKSLAGHMAATGQHDVVAISKREQDLIKGVRHIKYKPEFKATPTTFPDLARLEEHIHFGQLAARKAIELKQSGFTPDIICVHPGWGEAMYLRDVWPDAPQLHYCEFHFHARRGVHANLKNKGIPIASAFRSRTRNVLGLFSMEDADWGISPTGWQYSQFPELFKRKMSIIHEGINMSNCQPNPNAEFPLPNKVKLTAADEVVTYVSRNLEPTRGFPQFMRAAEILCRERPNCQIVVVGGDEVSYSDGLPDGETFKERMLKEVELDLDRVHFVGKLPYLYYLRLLQISSAHVYLTTPFVLSWSFLESMSVGCAIVASATQPVQEVMVDGKQGLLVEFDDPPAIAARVCELLDGKHDIRALRRAARQTIAERFRLQDCLRAQLSLVEDIANGRRPKPGPYRVGAPEVPDLAAS